VRADRLLQLLYLLRRHGRLPARRLSELLEVSERTILRDMEALSTAGVPVYAERGRHGGCVLLEGYSTDVSGLSAPEAQALFAWTSRAAVTDLGLGTELTSALTKLSATVPHPALEQADALASVVVVDRRRWFAAVEEVPLLPTLREAAVARQRLRLSYRSRSSSTAGERTVDPYGLVENAGHWYLLAAHRGRVRSYRVSRIEAARVLTDPARVPDELDLEATWVAVRAAFEGSEGAVVLRVAVDPGWADHFRAIASSQLSPGTVITTVAERDGWPVLELTVRARQAAVALVLGFGGDVRLLAPDDLVTEMLRRARASLALHTS